jgi:hypothetical protein
LGQEVSKRQKIVNIQHVIEEELRLFLEGKAEDLVAKFPELQPAYDAGIKNPQYLQWIQKRRGGEPVEDIIGVVQSFDAAKQRLKAKKMSPDIYAYKTPAVLRQALEDLGGSKGEERRRLKDEETTYIGEFGDWVVAMPHTRESSCQLGKGTTWCTAATQSQNLFLSYVARKRNNIVLYYVIKKGADPRQDPTSKLSVGFAGGEPVFRGDYGGVTVDAANNGIDYEKYKEILGDQALPALRAMEAHADSIEGKHPAKKQIEKIAKDPDAFDKAIANMGENEKLDFIRNVAEYEPSSEVARKIAGDKNHKIRSLVAKNSSTPPEVLQKLDSDEEAYIRMYVARNLSTPIEALLRLANDKNFYVHSKAKSHPTYLAYMKKQGMNESLFVQRTTYNEGNTMKLTRTELLRLVEEVVEESHTKADEEKLKKISKQLKKSVKMHSDQSDAIDDIIDRSDDEELNEKINRMIREEYKALMEEKKSAKDKMKCNSPRRIRKGEAGHGKKKFVVKACDGGTEKIIRYGDAGLKIKRKQKGRRKNFRARHNCDNPGSKLKARYWSCKNW